MKRFDQLTRKEQRLAIIKDMIARIEGRRLVPARGTWVDRYPFWDIAGSESVQTIVNKEGTVCRACMLGGAALTAIGFVNKVTVGELISAVNYKPIFKQKVGKSLRAWFTARQLAMMEIAFETGRGCFSHGNTGTGIDESEIPSNYDACVDFGSWYSDERERCLAILNNMLENDGLFKPEKR